MAAIGKAKRVVYVASAPRPLADDAYVHPRAADGRPVARSAGAPEPARVP